MSIKWFVVCKCPHKLITCSFKGLPTLKLEQIEGFKKLENKKIPEDIDYEKVKGIRIEARQKLEKFRPTSIGQALRISGVNPVDISLLMVYIKKEYFYESK